MIIDCKNDPTWKYIKTTENKSYYCKDNVIVKLTHIVESDNSTYDIVSVVTYVSKTHKYSSVLPCVDCGALPELRIDKNTGKYYCTCPSSFYGDTEEIGDDPLYGISSNTLIFDDISDAIDAWNDDMSYKHLIFKIKDIVNKVDTYDDFSKQFDEIIFVPFIHDERYKLQKLFSICMLFFQCPYENMIVDDIPEFYQSIWNNSKHYDEAKNVYNQLIDNLKKIIYFNYKYLKDSSKNKK